MVVVFVVNWFWCLIDNRVVDLYGGIFKNCLVLIYRNIMNKNEILIIKGYYGYGYGNVSEIR